MRHARLRLRPALTTALACACAAPSRAPRDARSPSACLADRALIEAARENELRTLDRLLGPFTRGAVAVYSGRVSMRERLSAIGRADARFDGDALAAAAPSSFGPALYLMSARHDAMTMLFQSQLEPGAIASTGVIEFGTGAGEAGRCRGCVTPFTDGPPRVVADHAVLRGTYGGGEPRVIELDAALERVPAASVTLPAVVRLMAALHPGEAATLAAMTPSRGGVTREVEGGVSAPVDVAIDGGERRSCARIARYTARWWISSPRPSELRVEDVCVTRVALRCCVVAAERAFPCGPRAPSGCTDEPE